jgi:hypothetical protein
MESGERIDMGLYMKMIALGSIVLFGAIWMLLIIPGMITSIWFQSLNPMGQFFFYSIGAFVLLTGLIGGTVSLMIKGHLEPISMVMNGLSSFLVFSSIDLIQPPFAIDQGGTFIISTQGGTLAGTSIDYAFSWAFYQMGISGGGLWFTTYILLPVGLVLLAIVIFGAANILKIFGDGL